LTRSIASAAVAVAGSSGVTGGRCRDSPEHFEFVFLRRRQLLDAGIDVDPAGRAAGAPAAHRSVRDAGRAQRLEHGHARAYTDRRTLSILHAQLACAGDPPRPQRAHSEQRQQQEHEGRHADVLPVQHPVQHVERHAGLGGHAFEPALFGCVPHHLHPAGDVAGQGERRQQQRSREGEALVRRVPRLEPEPDMQADAGVQPGHYQQHRLQHAEVGRQKPQRRKLGEIAAADLERFVEPARGEHVSDQSERDERAEGGLPDLPGRHAQRPAHVQRPQRGPDMGQRGAAQQHGAGQGAPRHDGEPVAGVQRVERDHAERVVGEMADQVHEQDQPAVEADSTEHALASEGAVACDSHQTKYRAGTPAEDL
jgi:hypothetical protein